MSSRSADYEPGQQIPGTVYRVHRVIGAGGMGTVYDVEDTTVGRRYVLKTLHSDLADRADLAARLSREARALAKLQHPNIVEVFTSGTTKDHLNLPYYVMERLQGQSLRGGGRGQHRDAGQTGQAGEVSFHARTCQNPVREI